MTRCSPRLRGFRGRLLAIAAFGLVVRCAYTLVLGQDTSGNGDFFFYHGQANLLADGHGFAQPLYFADGVDVPSAEHPPLWPLVLSVTSLLGGTGFLAHRLTGCLLGAVAIVVVGLLGRRVAGERVGLIAAGLAAVYPTLIAADGSLMSETLYGVLVGSALLAAYHLLARPQPAAAGTLGVLIGLAALTRAEALLLVVLLALPVCWRAGGSARPRLMLAGAAVMGAVLVIAPWTARNWSAFDQPVLISINDSTVVAGANCGPAYSGPDTGFWRLDCLAPRERGGNEAEQAEVWREQGTEYARDHASRVAPVAAVRVLRSWDLWQPRRQAGFAEGRDRTVQEIGTAAYFLVLALAVWGAALLVRRRQTLLILVSPAVAVTISSALGYGLPRFRHAVELVLVVLAAVALDAVIASRRRAPGPGTA